MTHSSQLTAPSLLSIPLLMEVSDESVPLLVRCHRDPRGSSRRIVPTRRVPRQRRCTQALLALDVRCAVYTDVAMTDNDRPEVGITYALMLSCAVIWIPLLMLAYWP